MNQPLIESPQFDIRYTNQMDFGSLKRWLTLPEVRKWFPITTDKEVDMMTTNWINFSRYKSSLTATLMSQPIGIVTIFLMPYKKVAHIGMVYIVVDPDYQRQGLGTTLVKNINHLGKNYFKLETLHIELYSGSPAIPLFVKGGYHQVLSHPDYARVNGVKHDRIILETSL